MTNSKAIGAHTTETTLVFGVEVHETNFYFASITGNVLVVECNGSNIKGSIDRNTNFKGKTEQEKFDLIRSVIINSGKYHDIEEL